MKFSELVRLLEKNGFRVVKGKGSIRYYGKQGHDRLIRGGLPRLEGDSDGDVPRDSQSRGHQGLRAMLELKYSLVIEATDDPNFFGFYSPDLEGFTGVGHSVEDCLYKARWGMEEHVALLAEQNLPVPAPASNPTVVVRNEEHFEPVGS